MRPLRASSNLILPLAIALTSMTAFSSGGDEGNARQVGLPATCRPTTIVRGLLDITVPEERHDLSIRTEFNAEEHAAIRQEAMEEADRVFEIVHSHSTGSLRALKQMFKFRGLGDRTEFYVNRNKLLERESADEVARHLANISRLMLQIHGVDALGARAIRAFHTLRRSGNEHLTDRERILMDVS